MHLCYYFFVLVLIQLTRGKLMKINSKSDNTIFKYRKEASSERKLKECKKRDVCNIVNQRFWLPNIVERICRCSNGFECPWTSESNDYSMMLNNRSLLKFCEPVRTKDTCKHKQVAAIIRGRINANLSAIVARKVRINCNCPKTHNWKLQKYIFGDDNSLYQRFKCQKQTLCDSLDFCGYIRADYFSSYYHCYCPEGHLCIPKDREKENVQELLYTGAAYKAYCLRWN